MSVTGVAAHSAAQSHTVARVAALRLPASSSTRQIRSDVSAMGAAGSASDAVRRCGEPRLLPARRGSIGARASVEQRHVAGARRSWQHGQKGVLHCRSAADDFSRSCEPARTHFRSCPPQLPLHSTSRRSSPLSPPPLRPPVRSLHNAAIARTTATRLAPPRCLRAAPAPPLPSPPSTPHSPLRSPIPFPAFPPQRRQHKRRTQRPSRRAGSSSCCWTCRPPSVTRSGAVPCRAVPCRAVTCRDVPTGAE
ncbi:unnamed protein product, partial [Closterium sp. NIES-54]